MVEQNLKVLKDDHKVRYPIILWRLKLFLISKAKDKSVLSFISRVHEDAEHADIASLTKDDIIMTLIMEKCNTVELHECWGIDKNLNLEKLVMEAKAFTQSNKMLTDNGGSVTRR